MHAADETVHALKFSSWKRPYVRLLFPEVRFVESLEEVPAGARLLVWGRPELPGIGNFRVTRVEDGFLRSVGLGVDLVKPLSWIVDDQGIYFDAGTPSRLESLLLGESFDASLLSRASSIRQALVAARLSKYNVGTGEWRRPPGVSRVVLVVGQVETDASLAYGALGVRQNLAFLRAVRSRCPDAYLIYKPHPDVVAGMRQVGLGEESAGQWCDEVVTDVSGSSLLDAVDEVHVMTSLMGFEALLRGRPVVCHGMPFYAGWGLTTDVLSCARRQRILTLDELVAASLLCYPVYFDREGKRLISAEEAIDSLIAWRDSYRGASWWQGGWRQLLRWVVGVR